MQAEYHGVRTLNTVGMEQKKQEQERRKEQALLSLDQDLDGNNAWGDDTL